MLGRDTWNALSAEDKKKWDEVSEDGKSKIISKKDQPCRGRPQNNNNRRGFKGSLHESGQELEDEETGGLEAKIHEKSANNGSLLTMATQCTPTQSKNQVEVPLHQLPSKHSANVDVSSHESNRGYYEAGAHDHKDERPLTNLMAGLQIDNDEDSDSYSLDDEGNLVIVTRDTNGTASVSPQGRTVNVVNFGAFQLETDEEYHIEDDEGQTREGWLDGDITTLPPLEIPWFGPDIEQSEEDSESDQNEDPSNLEPVIEQLDEDAESEHEEELSKSEPTDVML